VKVWGVVPAGGTGERLGGGRPKALLEVAGRPLIEWCILALSESRGIDGVVVAGPDQLTAFLRDWPLEARIVPGGATRSESVFRALAAVPADATHVLVHDAARPLLSAALIHLVIAKLKESDAVVPVLPSTDTMKRLEGDLVVGTVPRNDAWRAQTPQGFRASLLRQAHARAREENFEGTDDASLVERLGIRPASVPGEGMNIKVTTREDLELAEALIRARQ
jgi:2-C-methyl-D-erythritol 4-phosphate cytidylyltransferase